MISWSNCSLLTTDIPTTLIERVDTSSNHSKDDQDTMDNGHLSRITDIPSDHMSKNDGSNNPSLNPNRLPILHQFASVQSILDTKVVEWSDDDRICLLTEGGALIFSHDATFMDSSSGLYPLKHLIPNPVEPFSLAKIDELIIDEAFNLNHKQTKQKEPTRPLIRPLFLNEGFSSYFLKYQMSAWSPTTHHRGCILALLSYDNRLTLYAYTRNDWTLLTDIFFLNSLLR